MQLDISGGDLGEMDRAIYRLLGNESCIYRLMDDE